MQRQRIAVSAGDEALFWAPAALLAQGSMVAVLAMVLWASGAAEAAVLASAAAMVHDVWKKSACSWIGGTPIEWGSYDGQANS